MTVPIPAKIAITRMNRLTCCPRSRRSPIHIMLVAGGATQSRGAAPSGISTDNSCWRHIGHVAKLPVGRCSTMLRRQDSQQRWPHVEPPQLTFLHANWTFAAGFDLIEHTGRCGCGHDVRIKRRHGQVAPLRSHQSTHAVSSLVAFFVVFVHTHPPTHTHTHTHKAVIVLPEFFLSVGRVFIRFIRFRKYTHILWHKSATQGDRTGRKGTAEGIAKPPRENGRYVE